MSNSYFYSVRCLVQVLICTFQNNRTALPLSIGSRADQFSEGRALRIIKRLADDFPHRQVGTLSNFVHKHASRVAQAKDDKAAACSCPV